MSILVDDRELRALLRRLEKAGRATDSNIQTMLKKIGVIVLGKARAYSPMSMSKSQYISTLKTGKTKRKVFTRGSLKESITMELKKNQVEIGVPANSKAGDYAEKMHDDRGKSWKNLSAGKQPQSTDKYIYKAQEDSEKQYLKAVDDFVDKIIKAL